jgi:hypothetical protein
MFSATDRFRLHDLLQLCIARRFCSHRFQGDGERRRSRSMGHNAAVQLGPPAGETAISHTAGNREAKSSRERQRDFITLDERRIKWPSDVR